MTKRKVGGSGAILKDNHGHEECNSECKGAIHVVYQRRGGVSET